MVRLVLIWLACALAAAPFDDASTATCLLDRSQTCDAAAPCSAADRFTRACLDARVPFRTAYRRVKCCLRCCFSAHLRAYGLDRNWKRFAARGAREGALEARGGLGDMLELLAGHNHESTLPFATRRLSKLQNAWLKASEPALQKAKKTFGAELKLECGGGGCLEADRRDTEARLWSERRTGTPARGSDDAVPLLAHGETGRWRGPGWVEAHFGDGCGDQARMGAYRELTLATLYRKLAAIPPGAAPLNLVTSTDCDLPHGDERGRLKREAFDGENSVLNSSGLRRWYTTNPSDHVGRAHPKLRAVPLGVSDRRKWLVELDGRETRRGRGSLLMCCCMSSHPTPALQDELWAPAPHSSFAKLNPDVRARLNDVPGLVGPGGPEQCGIPPLVLGYTKNSSKFSTAVKSNSFRTILGPSVLALRGLDD